MKTRWNKWLAGLAGMFWGTPVFAASWSGTALIAQADEAAPTTRSGLDFVVPTMIVIVLFGVATFAVCRSSHRV